MPVREKRKGRSQVKDERKVPHATCQLRPSQENQRHLLPGSILSVFRCDLCLFMDHYFGHWHVRVLLFGLFNCLSQRLSPGNHRRAKTKRRRNMHDQQQGGDLWARSIYTIYKWGTMTAKRIIHCILESYFRKCLDCMVDHKNSTAKSRANTCFSVSLTRYLPSHTHYLVMVDVCVACDDYSLLNPRLRNTSFHSLKGRNKCSECAHSEEPSLFDGGNGRKC